MPGRVSPAERQLADALRRQVARFERKSVEAAARLAGRVVPKTLAAYRRGAFEIEITEIISETIDRSAPAFTETMVLSHLTGTRQVVDSARPIRSAAVHTEAVKSLQRRLDMSNKDLAVLTEKYGETAVTALQGVSSDVNRAITKELTAITSEGLTTRDGVKRLRGTFERTGVDPTNPYLVDTVMRTQTQIAYSVGRYQEEQDPAYQEILVSLKYVTVGDDRVREEHAAMDGVVAPKDDPIWLVWRPPNGFNSVPPETPVLTEHGWRPIVSIRHGDRVVTHEGRLRRVRELHRHEGPDEIVSVHLDTLDSLSLSLTGNHPVLTDRGWVEASRLQVGDNVAHEDGIPVPDHSRWDVNDVRQAERVYDREVATEVRPHRAPLQFDPDTHLEEVEVQPESGRVLVEDERHAIGFQGVNEHRLVLARLALGVDMRAWVAPVVSDFRRPHLRLHFGPERGAGRPQLLGGLLRSRRVQDVADDIRFAPAAEAHAMSLEHSAQGPELHAGPAGYHGEIAAPVGVVAEHRSHAARPSRVDSGLRPYGPQIRHSAIVPMAFSPVKKILKIPRKSFVYNLAVEEDDSYIASGIAVHNCRCSLIPIFDDRPAVAPEPVVIDKGTPFERTIPVGEPAPGFDVNFGKVFGGQPITEIA